ncbi:MAG: phosphoribosylglycinamide synthetase C domain-containing protein [Candidatus Gastranaerophilales bacterium]|nr:phosphoribosylglycinamide synthetase C domain-containing protein [Candidatus Gastranaerophilales bacterium]
MEKSGKKVFIIGSDASAYSVAEKMSEINEVSEVFVAPGNNGMKDFSTVVDIRENNVRELLEFALENGIDLTVVISEIAVKNHIATVFQENNQMIFAPTKNSAEICLSRSVCRKFMYKTRIPCPKFGIFDKSNMAIDYLKKTNMPVVVSTDEHRSKGTLLCNSFSIAKTCVEELFDTNEKKVIIDDYIFGHEFSFYVVTDGYQALPLGSVATYKHELEGNGGLLTEGMGSFTPDYKISKQVEDKIMQQIIYPILIALEKQQTPYVGILGIDLVINDAEQLFALEFNSFIKPADCQGVLTLLNENIYNLFQACVIGAFADDYEKIDIVDKYAASCVISAKKPDTIIYGLDNLDENTSVAHFNTRKNQYLEYETTGGNTLVLTRTARTLSKAVEDLYEEVSAVKFDGMKYRKDIAKV